MNLQEANDKLLAIYSAKVGHAAGPEVGGALIDFLMKLLTGCFASGNSAEEVRTMAETHPVLARFRMRSTLRELGMWNRRDSATIMATVEEAASKATAKDIESLRAEAS